MLNFYPDAPLYGFKDTVEPALATHFEEVRQYLPELPATINIWLTSEFVIPETGSGGFAYAPDIITIGCDPEFPDKQAQIRNLKGMVFHESYHLVQGHTANDTQAQYTNLLDSAIYEGCASVFEREYSNTSPLWSKYNQHSDKQLTTWRAEMTAIPYSGDHSTIGSIYDSWAFFDESDQQRWKLYKTGTWLVDQALTKSGKDILDLRHLSATQILQLAQG